MKPVTLPWPGKASNLHPNSRPRHWTIKARAVKAARKQAWALALEAGARKDRFTGPIQIRLTFHPPTSHPADEDNMVAACKAYLDGLADALDVNDSRFRLTHRMAEPLKTARVIIEVAPPQEETA